MRKIINGKLYDTEKAHLVGSDSGNVGTFQQWEESLYLKKTKEFFLYGSGGPASKYAHSIGLNQWSGGEKIIPLNLHAARKWVEEHLDADDYERIFGLPDEDAEDVALNIRIPAALSAKLKLHATEKACSITTLVIDLLENALK